MSTQERKAPKLALESAAIRALNAWDTTVLPRANDGMMQERMEELREALAAPKKYDSMELHVTHSIVAGVLYDFMGWLTTRRTRLVLSDKDNASPAVDAIVDFAKMRGLMLEDAQVEHWQKVLVSPPKAERPAQQQEQDRQIDQLIQERDHRDEIIDKLCDAVLGPDRYEWSSQYFFEDAVREVEEHMAALKQPAQQQEPVAWAESDGEGGICWTYDNCFSDDPSWHENPVPLYTSPPPRKPWVGLTDEDVTSSHPYSITRDKGCFHAGALWAEAKLKEKNA